LAQQVNIFVGASYQQQKKIQNQHKKLKQQKEAHSATNHV